MSCYDATLGKPEGVLDAQQVQAFQKMDTLFKATLLSVLGENIVDAYASIDNGKDMWDALEAKFGVSDAGTELYIMEQFYDYRMTEERSVVEQAHEIQSFARELEHFSCMLPDKFEGGSSANLVQKKNFQPHKFKNKGKFDGKAKFDGKNKAVQYTNF